MSDPTNGDDGVVDRELRRLAREALSEAQRRADVDAGLARMSGEATASVDGARARQSPWLLAGAAAAVVALVVGGLVMSRDTGPDTVRTATSEEPAVATTTPPPATDATAATTIPPGATGATTPPSAAATTSTAVPLTTITSTTAPTDSPATASGTELAIGRRCVTESACTQLAAMPDGRIAAYEPADDVIELFDASGLVSEARIELSESFADRGAWLAMIGPDDVAYFSVTPAEASDPILDLVAVALRGPSAGTVRLVAQGLDGSGDTDLVATPDGLATVGCCGFDSLRPTPDATTYQWVDRKGEPTTSRAAVFEWRLGEPRDVVTRIDGETRTEFAAPLVASSPRGMPWIVATDDGGALMADYSQQYLTSYLVRFRPGVDVENTEIVQVPASRRIALLESAGTVVVADGERFVRYELAEIGPSMPETGVEFRTEPGEAIESCGDRNALSVEDALAVEEPLTVHGGPVGTTGVYVAIDDAFGRRLMAGCGEAASASNPLAGEGFLVWPMTGATGVAIAAPSDGAFGTRPDWLGVAVTQMAVTGADTLVEVFVVADDVALPTGGTDDERLLIGLIEQARADGTATASFGPALGT